MIYISTILFIIMFTIGSTTLFYAGKQDKQTRNPLLIIPAMILIGLSLNFITGILIALIGLFTIFLPKLVNDISGKADIFLFASIMIIFIFANNIIISLFFGINLAITLIRLIHELKKQKDLIKKEPLPLITIYAKSYLTTVIAFMLALLLFLFVIFFSLLLGEI